MVRTSDIIAGQVFGGIGDFGARLLAGMNKRDQIKNAKAADKARKMQAAQDRADRKTRQKRQDDRADSLLTQRNIAQARKFGGGGGPTASMSTPNQGNISAAQATGAGQAPQVGPSGLAFDPLFDVHDPFAPAPEPTIQQQRAELSNFTKGQFPGASAATIRDIVNQQLPLPSEKRGGGGFAEFERLQGLHGLGTESGAGFFNQPGPQAAPAAGAPGPQASLSEMAAPAQPAPMAPDQPGTLAARSLGTELEQFGTFEPMARTDDPTQFRLSEPLGAEQELALLLQAQRDPSLAASPLDARAAEMQRQRVQQNAFPRVEGSRFPDAVSATSAQAPGPIDPTQLPPDQLMMLLRQLQQGP